MPAHDLHDGHDAVAIPSIVDQPTWEAALAELRAREKAATRELDAIAAARRRLPTVELPEARSAPTHDLLPAGFQVHVFLRVGDTVIAPTTPRGAALSSSATPSRSSTSCLWTPGGVAGRSDGGHLLLAESRPPVVAKMICAPAVAGGGCRR